MKQLTVDEARGMLLEAMAERNRVRILAYLLEHGEANVGQLVDMLGMDQPGVSHHLRCLRDCGLVQSRRDGRFVIYRLNGKRRIARILTLLDNHASDHLEGILGCRIVGDE